MDHRVTEVRDVVSPDRIATQISNDWITWNMLRQNKLDDWEEIRRYVYATNTSQTSNASNPWKNRTTIPKLCQIRDNLLANYTATMFPNSVPVEWEANEKDSDSKNKRDAITNYMQWVMSQPSFKGEMNKVVSDYIDYGNCFVSVEWVDQRVEQPTEAMQAGYVGPALKRISPLDVVMNPTASNFESTPKIVRSVIGLGELKEMLNRMSTIENEAEMKALWKYFQDIRAQAREFSGEWVQRDNLYQVDGFTSFQQYLSSNSVEILTFYGDLYDVNEDKLYKNYVFTVVDRHKLLGSKPNPSFYGYPPIFHAAWRIKQDNLWGMGPLDNLVGMQYRIDHIENLKADVWDLVTFPVVNVKGFVEEFNWQPGEIIRSSEEGSVELLQPQVQILQSDTAIQFYMNMMEEIAGAPKEAMGFRSPGEKTKYEVQRLENAASRIFQNKIKQFEEQIEERLLNAMLELARRNLSGVTTIKVFDDELKAASFKSLTVEDITGIGRIRPVAARHFAEQAELIQNLTSLSQSPIYQDIKPHISMIKMAQLFAKAFNVEEDGVIMPPWVGLIEQSEGQRMAQASQEQVAQATQTASGMGQDFDLQPNPAQRVLQPQGPQ
jgi:hypothetical protein